MFYANSYKEDLSYQQGDFILSDVCKADLKRFNIKMSVTSFKAMCKSFADYKIVLTGGAGHVRKTRVYNYYNILNKK